MSGAPHEDVRRPPHPRLPPRGRRAAAAAPARLPLQLLRLAAAARAGDRAAVLAYDFLGFGLSEKPRDHDILAALAGRHGRGAGPAPRWGPPVFFVGHDMGTSVATELMARDLDGSLEMDLDRRPAASTARWSRAPPARPWVSGCSAAPDRARSWRGSRASASSATSSARSSRRHHPLSDEEAADQWSLLAHGGGSSLGHRTDPLHGRAGARAPRWHGALARLGEARCTSPGGCSTRWRPRSVLDARPGASAGGPADRASRTSATIRRSRIPAAIAAVALGRPWAAGPASGLDARNHGAIMPRFARAVAVPRTRRRGLIFRRLAGIFDGANPRGRRTRSGRETLITTEGLEKLKEELELLCRPTSGARSPIGSRRRANSGTSRRTPSTTTPRTSRRCSSSGSPSFRTGFAAPR